MRDNDDTKIDAWENLGSQTVVDPEPKMAFEWDATLIDSPPPTISSVPPAAMRKPTPSDSNDFRMCGVRTRMDLPSPAPRRVQPSFADRASLAPPSVRPFAVSIPPRATPSSRLHAHVALSLGIAIGATSVGAVAIGAAIARSSSYAASARSSSNANAPPTESNLDRIVPSASASAGQRADPPRRP
jgi:hypothetical protein